MSDLRTRIAYAIAQADGDEPGMEPASCDYEMADAVIAELGLRKQSQTGDIVNFIEGDGINYGRHRYITDWEPDNE
jgi:hypothetical protein